VVGGILFTSISLRLPELSVNADLGHGNFKPRSAHALYDQASSVLTSNISQVSTVHTSYTKHLEIYARYHFPRGLGAPAIYIPAQLIYFNVKGGEHNRRTNQKSDIS
jgi:hypothetical protein